MVCSLTAAGVGLNLQVASNVVLAELSWTDAEQTQAIDRVHRIGQAEPVTAWRIIAAQTIDTKIAELIDSKAGLAARALDGSDEEVVLLGRRPARGARRAAHRGVVGGAVAPRGVVRLRSPGRDHVVISLATLHLDNPEAEPGQRPGPGGVIDGGHRCRGASRGRGIVPVCGRRRL